MVPQDGVIPTAYSDPSKSRRRFHGYTFANTEVLNNLVK